MDDLDDVARLARLRPDQSHRVILRNAAALVYLRQHPERVRTVTLIGVAPTYSKDADVSRAGGGSRNGTVVAQCEQDAQCHQAFPQIRDDWTSVLSQLGREPARVEYSPPDESAP